MEVNISVGLLDDLTHSSVEEQVVESVAADGNSPDLDARPTTMPENDDDTTTAEVSESSPTARPIEIEVVKVGDDDKSWDTGDNSACINQDEIPSPELDEVNNDNDTNKEELVQQEGYIAMSENGEHCVFIPAEHVEEEMIQVQATDRTVILAPKQEHEDNIVINNVGRSEHHFTNQQLKREMPPLAPLSKQDQTTRIHQHEENAMMINFHNHPQSVSIPDQTSQIPIHNQYNSSIPLNFSPSRRGNQQQMCTIMQQIPYPTHVQQTRAAFQNPVYMQQQDQVNFNNGSTMSSYSHLPPVSSLRSATDIGNPTITHPMNNVHQQTTVIAGGGDSVINSSPAKDVLHYNNQYFMKAPQMKSISPLKTDIQENSQMERRDDQNVGPLYRMDGRPSQGLVQQVLQVFQKSKKKEMQPCEVYYELAKLYPLYTTYHGQKKKSWMSSVRHALTHPAFKSRRADENNERESHRKGCFWSINDSYDPQAPLPRRRRKVQRKATFMNNQQQLQYMMMPMAMANEHMMGPQTTTTFSPMMSGNMMPAYITTQNTGIAHTFGDNNTQHPAMNIIQPQPMMVPQFGNANNNNMIQFGQFCANYQNQIPANTFMEQMKAAEIPLKKANIPNAQQVAPQPIGVCPYIHHDNSAVQKPLQNPESDAKTTRETNQPGPESTLSTQLDEADKQSNECSTSIAQQFSEADGNYQHASNNSIEKPPTEADEMKQETQLS